MYFFSKEGGAGLAYKVSVLTNQWSPCHYCKLLVVVVRDEADRQRYGLDGETNCWEIARLLGIAHFETKVVNALTL